MKTQIRNLTALTIASLTAASCASAPEASVASNTRENASQLKPSRSQAQLITFESDANAFNTKTFFYDNGEEVVAFDAQFTPDQARKAIELLRTRTQNPITYVVVTHPNPDKFNGASVFQSLGAKVIASRQTATAIPGTHAYKKYYFVEMAKMFTNETYPREARVDEIFDREATLRLKNGEVIVLRELGQAGVSTNQTVALIPRQQTMIVGDLVHHKAHAWLEGGIRDGQARPEIESWVKVLRALPGLVKNPTEWTVYGGRGDAAKLDVVVREQAKYLIMADRLVMKYVRSLGPKAAAELKGPNANAHYERITKAMEKAFPDYGLSYMVQYGVYGLVNSKL